jgi:DNA recombination protein RmuC
MTDPVVFIVGAGVVLLAVLITLLYVKSKHAGRLVVLEEQLRLKQVQLQEQMDIQTKLQTEKEHLLSKLSRAETQYESAQQAIVSVQQGAEKLNEQLKLEFAEIARRIMTDQSNHLSAKSEEKLGELLKPLKTEIGEFKKKVEETYDKESKERFSLGKEIDRLVQMSLQVSQEANNLSTALKGNNKVQGNWGEMLLESILEKSGLTAGREFVTQSFIRDAAGQVIKDDQGKGLQPDVMVYYPDQRTIIIDSKVSLVHWEQYINGETEEERKRALDQHLLSLRAHIDGLSKKNYPKYAKALDYVLLFVPVEPAFLEAVKKDTLLWKYAYDKKIMLVSPTNLLAVLKIIADLWKVEQQNQHAIEIAEKAGAMYDKFVGFIASMEDVGKKLGDAQGAYEQAFKQLSTGKGNLVNRMEELKKMGAAAQKQIPDRVLYDPGQ